MNGEQQRQLPYVGRTKVLAAMLKMQEATPDTTPNGLKEGDKVKLNYSYLKADLDYPILVQARKDFIEQNKDKVFTVEFDKKRRVKPTVVCLAEDTTDPKWYWTDGQLTKVNEDTEHEDN